MVSKPVLLLSEYGTINGGENSLLAVIPALQARGWHFVAAVPPGSGFAAALDEIGIGNVGVTFTDQAGTARSSQSEIRERIAGIIRQCSPGLVHCNSLSISRLCGPVTAELQVPSLGYLRDILNLSKKAISDINQLDAIIAVSQATADWHVQRGMDEQKIDVIYNGIDVERFTASAVSSPEVSTADFPGQPGIESPGIADTVAGRTPGCILLSVGQIGMRKGLDTLLNSFRRVIAQRPETKLLIAGRRFSKKLEAIEYENRLHRMADEINAGLPSPAVMFVGVRNDIPRLMQQADILVHTARQEPLGRVLLEACASSLAVVATDCGGSREILATGGFDPLCDVDDDSRIAARILTLIESASLRESVGAENCERIRTLFPVEACAARLDRKYRKILAGQSSRAADEGI